MCAFCKLVGVTLPTRYFVVICSNYYLTSENEEEINRKPKIGDFIVVKFPTKKDVKHYIGEVLNFLDDECNVKFMRRCLQHAFVFPQVDDISLIQEQDIVKVLNPPTAVRRGIFKFDCDLSNFNL